MKRLFLALLSLSLFATCAIPASAQIPLENPDVTVISTVCPNPDCLNNEIPPRDGTGYQGGQKGYQNEQKQGKHYAKRTGNCQGNRAVCRYCA